MRYKRIGVGFTLVYIDVTGVRKWLGVHELRVVRRRQTGETLRSVAVARTRSVAVARLCALVHAFVLVRCLWLSDSSP